MEQNSVSSVSDGSIGSWSDVSSVSRSNVSSVRDWLMPERETLETVRSKKKSSGLGGSSKSVRAKRG